MKKFYFLVLVSIFATIFSEARAVGPKDFERAIRSKDMAIVKFWASWCMPCSILKPEFEKAKRKMGRKVTFLEYNVDLGGAPLTKYNIQLLPTIVLFKNGKEVDRKSEVLDSSAIVEWIKEYR